MVTVFIHDHCGFPTGLFYAEGPLVVRRQGIRSRVPFLRQHDPIREADQSHRHLEPLGIFVQRHWQLSSLKNFKRGVCSAGQLDEEARETHD